MKEACKKKHSYYVSLSKEKRWSVQSCDTVLFYSLFTSSSRLNMFKMILLNMSITELRTMKLKSVNNSLEK